MPSNIIPALALNSGMEIEAATDFAKRIVELEAKCEELKGEKINLQAEVKDLKLKEEKLKEKFVKQKEKRANLEEKINLEKNKGRDEGEKMSKKFRQLEVEKRKLEVDLKAAAREKADEAAVRLRASEAEAKVQRLESLLEQKEDTITVLLGKIEALEKEETVRNSQLLDLKNLLEEGYNNIAAFQREKMKTVNLDQSVVDFMCTASASNENKVSKIVENGDLQNSGKKSSDGSHNEPQKDMCTDSASNEKEVKTVMENGNSQSSGQKSVDGSHNNPQRENIDESALQSKGHNKQVQFKGNDVSFARKSIGSENVQINDGSNKEYGDGIIRKCTTKELEILSHERTLVVASQLTNRKAEISVVPQRRKVEALGCSVEKQIGIKQCKSDDRLDRMLKWESAQKMFNAFVANDELCMRSVCALYRKHKSLGQWKNCLPSHNRGFKPSHEMKGMALGELLTGGDPEGRLKKSVSEFERVKPSGPDDCRVIARHHHLELFAIYKNNLDPHYVPDETV